MNKQATARASSDQSSGSLLKELLKTGLIVLLVVLPLRIFIAQPFIVSGSSMQPTFETGDYLIIDQLTYDFEEPQRKDVVVFRYPDNPSKFYIKRIIGLPGETVEVNQDETKIINDEHPEGFTLDEPYVLDKNHNLESITRSLNDDEYFVLGDNRSSSSDSRMWGGLPEHFIVGRAYLQLLPVNEMRVTPGYESNNTGANVASEAP